jgi:hypothetical protein
VKALVAIAVVLSAGIFVGWSIRPHFDWAHDYGEAERLQGTRGEGNPLPTQESLGEGHTMLEAPNGDRIIIVNGRFQLRLTPSVRFALIERLGTR